MPRPPVHDIPRIHEDLIANPWTDANDESRTLVAKTEVEPSETISIKTSDHSQSQTTSGDPLYSPSVLSDEFQEVQRGAGPPENVHETRPSLKRAISRNGKTFDGAQPVDNNEESETTGTDVIEHQIQPGDSLPGVALKYNVSLATLRSANKLWANDTIHLRQVLYIPIQAIATGKAKAIPNSARARPEHPSHSLHPAPEVHTRTFPHTRRSSSDWATNTEPEATVPHASSVRYIFSGSIKRVPLSELSFFPPSSTSTLSSPMRTSLRTQSQSYFPSDNARPLSPSFLNHSIRVSPRLGLANFWNGARDEIINRLSFDSTRGSSDASEENDLELDVVRPVRVRNRSTDSDREQELISRSDGSAIAMHSITERGSLILNTPRNPQVVRSIQLQPSPTMVIPSRVNISRTMSDK